MSGITLYSGAGDGTGVAVHGSAANVPVTVYGHAGVQEEFGADTFGADGLPVAFLAPVAFHGAGSFSFAFYDDNLTTAPQQTYAVSVDPTAPTRQLVQQTGESMISYDGVDEVILETASAGGSAINVSGVAQGMTLAVDGASGDVMTVGMPVPPPTQGRTPAMIYGSVIFSDGNGGNLIVDDSAGTQGRNATIDPPPNDLSNPFTTVTGLTPTAGTAIE